MRFGMRGRAWVGLLLAGLLWTQPVAAQESASAQEPAPASSLAEAELTRALSLTPDLENGLRVYRVCAQCHQPEGWGKPDGSVPQLAGQHRKVLIKQLADIRAGVRSNPEMAAHVSRERIGGAQAVADVAGYIDTLEISVSNGVGPGDDLLRGAELYAETCASCHGERGEGDAKLAIPRIHAQHYAYLLRQFRKIKAGERGNADPAMAAAIQAFSEADTRAVLDLVSRLRPLDLLVAPPGWQNPDFLD